VEGSGDGFSGRERKWRALRRATKTVGPRTTTGDDYLCNPEVLPLTEILF